jgi:hypothetical protein
MEIKNKKHPQAEGKDGLKFSNLIIEGMYQAPAPEGGFGLKEMRTSMQVIDICEKANGKITMNEDQVKMVKEVCGQMRFKRLDPFFMDFLETIEKL